MTQADGGPQAAGATPRRRRRRVAFVLGALAVGGCLALVSLEALARALWDLPPAMAEFQQKGLYAETASGGTGLGPGYRGRLRLSEQEPWTTVSVNALGMRGPDVAAKRAGEQRVLVVGDSLVFGYGVEAEQAFPARLEQRLRTGGRDVTVGNGGISGFNSFEAAQRIGDLRAGFAPDAVVFTVYLGNDALENRNRDFAVVGGLRFSGPWAVLMRDSLRARMATRSRFLLWLETWLVTNAPQSSLLAGMTLSPELLALREGFPGSPPEWSQCHAGLFLDAVDEQAAWPATAPAVVPRVLDDLRAALQQAVGHARGAPVIVLVLPTWWHCTDSAWAARLAELQFDPAQFRRGLAQQRVVAVCTELGLPCLDATPWLEAPGDPMVQFVSDRGHLSVAGHERVAEGLSAAVQGALK
ncbi:MAG: hypothetical protein RL148_62 [Planctomycetota bacterium]